jgi:hypothetical protein
MQPTAGLPYAHRISFHLFVDLLLNTCHFVLPLFRNLRVFVNYTAGCFPEKIPVKLIAICSRNVLYRPESVS